MATSLLLECWLDRVSSLVLVPSALRIILILCPYLITEHDFNNSWSKYGRSSSDMASEESAAAYSSVSSFERPRSAIQTDHSALVLSSAM